MADEEDLTPEDLIAQMTGVPVDAPPDEEEDLDDAAIAKLVAEAEAATAKLQETITELCKGAVEENIVAAGENPEQLIIRPQGLAALEEALRGLEDRADTFAAVEIVGSYAQFVNDERQSPRAAQRFIDLISWIAERHSESQIEEEEMDAPAAVATQASPQRPNEGLERHTGGISLRGGFPKPGKTKKN